MSCQQQRAQWVAADQALQDSITARDEAQSAVADAEATEAQAQQDVVTKSQVADEAYSAYVRCIQG